MPRAMASSHRSLLVEKERKRQVRATGSSMLKRRANLEDLTRVSLSSLKAAKGSLVITEGAATIGARTTARRVDRLVAISLAYSPTAKAASRQPALDIVRVGEKVAGRTSGIIAPDCTRPVPVEADHQASSCLIGTGCRSAQLLNNKEHIAWQECWSTDQQLKLAQEESTPATEGQYPSLKLARVHRKVVELEKGRNNQKHKEAAALNSRSRNKGRFMRFTRVHEKPVELGLRAGHREEESLSCAQKFELGESTDSWGDVS
eukprot:SM000020S06101  [mRNA]  locus=s20:1095850:1106301:+ [translate_table: standard]